MRINENFKIGDLLEVTKTDNLSFKCIVVEDHRPGGFVCKVLEKDAGVGTGTWNRYGLKEDFRLQLLSECKEIKVLSEATKSIASSTLRLNEAVTKQDLTFYETDLLNGKKSVFCVCEGYGGWAILNKDNKEFLKESYFEAQLSKLKEENLK